MSLTPDFARIHNDDPNANRLPEKKGALVLRVLPGSPAALFGLRKDDLIVEVGGRVIACAAEADKFLDSCKPGEKTRIRFWKLVLDGIRISSMCTSQ